MKNHSLIGMVVFSCLILSGCALSRRDESFIIDPALELRKAKIQAQTMTGYQVLLSDKMQDIDVFGEWFVFSMDFGRNVEIFVMKKDGTELRRLTFNDCYDGKPKWFKYGSYALLPNIIFYSNMHGKHNWYMMGCDGKNVEDIHTHLSLDGKKWLFRDEDNFYLIYYDGPVSKGYSSDKNINEYYWTKDGDIIYTTGSEEHNEYYKCSFNGDFSIISKEDYNRLKEEYFRLTK